MISETDRALAKKIGNLIGVVDALVVPNNPIKRIELVQSEPKLDDDGGGSYFRYVSEGEKIEERYVVFADGLIKNLDLIIKDINREDCFFKRNLLIATIVGHEVRHRLQWKNKISLFTPQNTIAVTELKETRGILITAFDEKRLVGDFELEFDAKMIEILIARKIISQSQKTINLDEISSIVLSSPISFLPQ